MLIVNLLERIDTGAVSIPQTPSEWLLARYDRVRRRSFGPQGDERRIRDDRGSNFDRRIFDVLDDHPGVACAVDDQGTCASWSGEASWPAPAPGEELDFATIEFVFEEIA